MTTMPFEIDIGFLGAPMTEETADAVMDSMRRTEAVVDVLTTRRGPELDEIDAYALLDVDDVEEAHALAWAIAMRCSLTLGLLGHESEVADFRIRRVSDEDAGIEREGAPAPAGA